MVGMGSVPRQVSELPTVGYLGKLGTKSMNKKACMYCNLGKQIPLPDDTRTDNNQKPPANSAIVRSAALTYIHIYQPKLKSRLAVCARSLLGRCYILSFKCVGVRKAACAHSPVPAIDVFGMHAVQRPDQRDIPGSCRSQTFNYVSRKQLQCSRAALGFLDSTWFAEIQCNLIKPESSHVERGNGCRSPSSYCNTVDLTALMGVDLHNRHCSKIVELAI